MANGFLTSSPGSRHTGTTGLYPQNIAAAQKFTCPGSGIQELSEIGLWCCINAGTATFILGVFSHDSSNNCPAALVSNSASDQLSTTSTSVVKKNHTYSTKPELTGGAVYWLALFTNSNLYADANSTGGTTVYSSANYATWPTDGEWHTHTDTTWEHGIYVVYAQKPLVKNLIGVAQVAIKKYLGIANASMKKIYGVDEHV